MFRKKETVVSTTLELHKEAKQFQDAVTEINTKYKPALLNIDIITGVAEKYGIEVSFLAGAFETYLKNNALVEIRRIKSSSDYSLFDLEKASTAYGFELDDLQITFFSQE
jgi:hypothetical protein